MTIPLRTSVFPLLLLGALACDAETFGAGDIVVDPTATVLEGALLPGARLTLTAPSLQWARSPMIVVIDGSAEAAATRTPDRLDQISFQLPQDLATGSHRLELRADGISTGWVASIRSGGFSEVRYVAGALEGILQPIPGRVELVGGVRNIGSDNDRIGILDLQNARLIIPEGGEYRAHFGLGTSTRPGAFTLSLEIDDAWRPAGMRLGKLVVDSTDLWGGSLLVHEIGPGVYLDAAEHGVAHIWGPSVDPEAPWMVYVYSDALHLTTTGDGSWAIPGHTRSDSGVLIINRTNGRSHWSPRWRVASTAGGAAGEVFVLGYRDEDPWTEAPLWLGRIDAATGALLDSTLVLTPSGEPRMTSLGRVYALQSADYLVLVFPVGGVPDGFQIWTVGGYWELSIRDRTTLAEIAHVRSPVAADGCHLTEDPWLVEDPIAHRFYLTAGGCSGLTPILTFELPQ